MLDAPFVRRVAVSMQLLDIGYEHADWSVGRDFDRIRAYNPLGRVPTRCSMMARYCPNRR